MIVGRLMLAVCHTYYSLQAGVVSPKQWARRAAEFGYTHLVVADLNGLYGAVRFQNAVLEAGLQPLIGALVRPDPSLWAVAVVQTEAGYRRLCRLLSAIHLEADFSLPDSLSADPPEGVAFLTRSSRTLALLAPTVGPDRLFRLPGGEGGELPLWEAPSNLSATPLLPVPDSWFLEPDDPETLGWLCELRKRAGGVPLPEVARHPGAVLPPAAEWRRAHPDPDKRVAVFANGCAFRMPTGRRPMVPKLDPSEAADPPGRLRELCRAAVETHYSPGSPRQRALRRLDHELGVVVEQGFADYFLYVHNIIGFAHREQIPVGVRGSAASSLVSYLLGFTQCCPIEHELLFERFMNPARTDCPDIDIDIADNRRDEVIAYCYRRWGEDHVAMVATLSTYRTRGAVHDAARLLDIPSREVQGYLDHGRAVRKQAELSRIAARLVGLPRHAGVHCGGLLITPCALTDAVPLFRSSKGLVATHFEKDQAEDLGLVKMDLLGNSALSVIDEAVRLVGDRGLEFRESGPKYDYKVNRLFSTGDTLGVYQCESPGMRQLCRALEPTSQQEASIALSLIRPGPAAAGMKEVYIRRKRGLEPTTHLHTRMQDFLGKTYGVMLYQEDVMNVAVHVAGYSFADADRLRRVMSTSRGTRPFTDEKHRFVFQKAGHSGVDRPTAEKIWEHVARFASYSYCKAHATVYGRLAWRTARLKAHHPKEFFTAALNCQKSMYPKRVMVWDAIRHGVPVLPVDIRLSGKRWHSTRYGIRAGFDLVKGLHNRTTDRILRERSRHAFEGMRDFCRRVNPVEADLESLLALGAFRGFGSREAVLQEWREFAGGHTQGHLFQLPAENLPALLDTELALTGIPFSTHPLQGLPPGVCPAQDIGKHIGRRVSMIGILDAVKELQTRKHDDQPGDPMTFVTLEDATGLFEAVFFPETHARFAGRFTTAGPYRLDGRVTESWGSASLEVEHVGNFDLAAE